MRTSPLRTLSILVVVLGVLAGVWFAYGDDPAPPATGTGAGGSAAAANGAAAPGGVGNADSAVVANEATDREPALPPWNGPFGAVKVVEFGSNRPLPGAELLCSPPGFDWQRLSARQRELAGRDREAFLRELTAPYHSDADGMAQVALGGNGVQIFARHGELWAEAWLRPTSEQPLVMALRPDRTLRVRVVDAGGQPVAGTAVMMRRGLGANERLFGCGQTDADGRVVYEHVQQLAEALTTLPLAVYAEFPGGQSDAIDIDAVAPPAEVVLRLPAAGRVIVQLRDRSDRPLDPRYLGRPSLRLVTWPERPASSIAEQEGLQRSPGELPIPTDGAAVFAAVAFDRFVMAEVSHWLRSEVQSGPTLAVPQVEVILREHPDEVLLLGVLLDADHRPCANVDYTVACIHGEGISGDNARTDEQGRFRVGLGRLPAGLDSRVSFRIGTVHGDDPQSIELPVRRLLSGPNPLGELQLQRHRLLAQGAVQCEWSGPHLPVQVQFERLVGAQWESEWTLRPEWQGRRFTVRGGIAAGARMRLSVATTEFLPIAPIEFLAGASDLAVVLQRGGSLTVSFVLDAGITLTSAPPHGPFRFRLRRTEPAGSDVEAERLDRTRRVGERSCQWSGLAPGQYQLQVSCVGGNEPVVDLSGIAVGEGACADPRLQSIDLRGQLRTFPVRLQSADGASLRSPDAFVIVRDRGGDWRGYHCGRGEVQLLAPKPLDLLLMAKGHQATFVDGVVGERTIPLPAATTASFVVAAPLPLPAGADLRLRLRPLRDGSDDPRLQLDNGRALDLAALFTEEGFVTADGRVQLPVRLPGRYRVELLLGTLQRSVMVASVEPAVVVLPAAGETAVTIGLQGWQAVLERLGR